MIPPTPPAPQPCSVVMELDDGSTLEEYFPSRYLAEVFLSLNPGAVGPDDGPRVVSAILSPVTVPVYRTPATEQN